MKTSGIKITTKGIGMWAIAFGILLGFALVSICWGPSDKVRKINSGKWYVSDFDQTDDAERRERSGLRLWIDFGTGCHYLQPNPLAPLTPRMGSDGKQICEKGEIHVQN